jgi:murein DD-endopeptidase MepM/ murein hydrolase activator NlpD
MGRSTARRPRRLSTLLALLIAMGSLSLPAIADPSPEDRLQDIEDRQDKVRERIEDTEAVTSRLAGTISDLDDQRSVLEARVAVLDGKLGTLNARIALVRADLTDAQQELTALTEELDRITKRLHRRTEIFEARAVEAYKAGPTAAIDGLLSSETFSDLVDRYSYYEAAIDAEAELIGEIESLQSETATKRDEVEAKKESIAAKKLDLEADRDQLAGVRDERADALAEKEGVISSKESLLADARSEAGELEDIESDLQADEDRIRAILAAASSGAPVSSGPLPTGGGQLLWPAAGPVVSGFGPRVHPIFGDVRMHTGIDIGAPYGAPIIAADDGVVSFAGVMSGYGNATIIDHGGGMATTYNHQSAFYVSDGQHVSRGQRIGAVGCTGYCTGPHLHFEVRINGTPVDPMPYLQ